MSWGNASYDIFAEQLSCCLFMATHAPECTADVAQIAHEPSTFKTAADCQTYDEFIMQLSWNDVLSPAHMSPAAAMQASIRPATVVLTSPILSMDSQVHVRSRGKKPGRRVIQSDESDGDKNIPREAACDGPCDVCGSDVGNLFQCQGQGNGECTVVVHMSCIGRKRPPKSNKWRCEECKAETVKLLIQKKRSSKFMNLEAQHGDDCDTSQGEDGNSSQVN